MYRTPFLAAWLPVNLKAFITEVDDANLIAISHIVEFNQLSQKRTFQLSLRNIDFKRSFKLDLPVDLNTLFAWDLLVSCYRSL